ncbi:hypothetical protein LEWO105114_09680 [Legionella worsleiensis]|uniref:Uncharacterized protein n=1 Tax=Legionella worsleiensis TaxID=45076 RepID=A0A0W1A9H3_9GAMM|nr:hypothetical protein Lwor_1859 [Legionella worsleiensis]STY31561.1 Uncharacterised protein [Legionella worsleiensis]
MSSTIALSYCLEEHTKWISHISVVILNVIIASILDTAEIVPSSTDVVFWVLLDFNFYPLIKQPN